MAAWIIEKALEVALAGLKRLAPGALLKPPELLEKRHQSGRSISWDGHIAVGKEVAKSAKKLRISYIDMATQVEREICQTLVPNGGRIARCPHSIGTNIRGRCRVNETRDRGSGTPGGGSGTLAEGTCGTQGWRSWGQPPRQGAMKELIS
ncbi:hypothetical protein Tco_1006049 [Tanacetum coccineum]|uniref:Uncharacterized protein n=1 Tax=Tanacetum coccineum TaxID=301880 RepID=A0ABQ5FGT7_9ASTR